MPTRGGRSGGRSGGGRSGGFRASRSSGSSSGSKGFRINLGNRSAPSSPSSTPSFSGTSGAGADPQDSNSTPYRRPWMNRPGFLNNPLGNIWRTIGIIIAVFVLGMCACVALGLIVQQLGLGS